MGWSLGGVSIIERAGVGKGAPKYDSSDIYVFDGQELIACQTGSVSPSCTTGAAGSGITYYSTKIESYQRIQYDSNTAKFTVDQLKRRLF